MLSIHQNVYRPSCVQVWGLSLFSKQRAVSLWVWAERREKQAWRPDPRLGGNFFKKRKFWTIFGWIDLICEIINWWIVWNYRLHDSVASGCRCSSSFLLPRLCVLLHEGFLSAAVMWRCVCVCVRPAEYIRPLHWSVSAAGGWCVAWKTHGSSQDDDAIADYITLIK